ncbi:Chitin-binding domain type 2 [Homalodisca vitripennis]|nr:Chitin-binding domain type 2 [Homalodisca vitripennis]
MRQEHSQETMLGVPDMSGQKSIQQEDPCKVKSRIVADATYCDRYWECVNGQPELYDCPNGLVYAGKNRGVTEGCDYPWRANYCEDKTQANGPIGRDHCDWLYGIFGHETSCTRYWTCWNGTATEQLCIGGLLYNENTHSCDWPENVDGCQKHRTYFLHDTRYYGRGSCLGCISNTIHETMVEASASYTVHEHSMVGLVSCTRYTKISMRGFSLVHDKPYYSRALCNDDANGNVPLGKSCNRYWQCQGGYPRLQRCPAMLVFDRRSLRCVVPPTEDCEVPTTPPPQPGDLEEDGEQNIPQQLQQRPQQQRAQQQQQSQQQPSINLPQGAFPVPVRNNRPRN